MAILYLIYIYIYVYRSSGDFHLHAAAGDENRAAIYKLLVILYTICFSDLIRGVYRYILVYIFFYLHQPDDTFRERERERNAPSSRFRSNPSFFRGGAFRFFSTSNVSRTSGGRAVNVAQLRRAQCAARAVIKCFWCNARPSNIIIIITREAYRDYLGHKYTPVQCRLLFKYEIKKNNNRNIVSRCTYVSLHLLPHYYVSNTRFRNDHRYTRILESAKIPKNKKTTFFFF